MGPKKKEILKKESKQYTIDDSINTDNWKCVVVMAVERHFRDNFVLRYFAEEVATGRRQHVKVINFESYVLKILHDFANGELPFKRAFLLNYSSVLQEAAEYVSKKIEIPTPLLARVVKALLLFFREESYSHMEKKAMGPVDPISEMRNRPAETSDGSLKKSEKLDKNKLKTTGRDLEVKVRPPSTTKLESQLLKRGEGVKEDQCVNDAPTDGYFKLYVLLTGFYVPELPLELIKANIPLHGVLCIDTSMSSAKRMSSTLMRFRKINSQTGDIHDFWDSFLKILWNPLYHPFFSDTIFQVYVPQKLLCDEQRLREFVFSEISFLMYDMSDYKRQLNNYLNHIKIRDVTEWKKLDLNERYATLSEKLTQECAFVPCIIENIIFAVSGRNINSSFLSSSISTVSLGTTVTLPSSPDITIKSESNLANHGSTVNTPPWSEIVFENDNVNQIALYTKIKELDEKYQIEDQVFLEETFDKMFFNKESNTGSCSKQRNKIWSSTIEDALKYKESKFNIYWKKLNKVSKSLDDSLLEMDFLLYPIIATRVSCPYEIRAPPSCVPKTFPLKKNSNFELIENLANEMRKPHFTVTEGSRSVLKSIPYNLKDKSKDFFDPNHLKIVSPEKLKCSSALEFRITPKLTAETSFISALVNPDEYTKNNKFNVYKNLEKFLGQDMIKNVNDFDFLEELNKSKLSKKETRFWEDYNCFDYNYSVLTNTVFVVLHHRNRDCDLRHRTFNEILKANVGLRDFFEYILEDESDWLESEEASYKSEQKSISGHFSKSKPPLKFKISDFWMEDSIKYEEHSKMKIHASSKERENERNKLLTQQKDSMKIKKKVSILDKSLSGKIVKERKDSKPVLSRSRDIRFFEAYNLDCGVVQFSGLTTEYYSKNCSITVDLLERLYGNQDVVVQVKQAGHSLYLHSFACPTPHLFDPYTCHVVYKNGIIMAFGRRPPDTNDLSEEIESEKWASKSESSTKEEVQSSTLSNDDFYYDMQFSLPNGLVVSVVRKIYKPCYIRQRYLDQSISSVAESELSRLFLPNGNVIKMMKSGTVEIFKPDTTIITTHVTNIFGESSELESLSQHGKVTLTSYVLTTADGYLRQILDQEVVSSKKIQILQNSDLKSKTTFYRRKDGTNYMLESDGTLVVQFKDGTKISSSCFLQNDEEAVSMNTSSEGFLIELDTTPEPGFQMVHMEFTVEHPSYVTVKYNTERKQWKMLLPCQSTVSITSEGVYSVKIDPQTELEVNPDIISMNRYSPAGDLQCSVIADLTVFEDSRREKIYIRMVDSTGKTFIVEANSNCYVSSEHGKETCEVEVMDKSVKTSGSFSTSCTSNAEPVGPGKKLSRYNKYFAVRRDLTGYELLHRDDAKRKLTAIPDESVVYTLENPISSELSVFVLISPAEEKIKKEHKWDVPSIIPDPKFFSALSPLKTSSTYGCPPSWMHPFPKRKKKFKTPENLTCRVFIEARKSGVVPVASSINCSYCESEDKVEVKYTRLKPGLKEFQNYLARLADDDQLILKEMYALKARDAFMEKLKQKPVNTEKLEKYLVRSKYCMDLQNYLKHAIRYHIVPNFFEHPAGMAWLLLNEQLENCKLFSEFERKRSFKSPHGQGSILTGMQNFSQIIAPSSGSKSTSSYSYEEIECNLNYIRWQSFSDLSCRSDVSAKTAPPVITKGGICTCKVHPARATKSSPMTYNAMKENQQGSSESQVDILDEYNNCGFRKEDFELIEKIRYDDTEKGTMTLEDLMSLGLV